MNSLQTLAAAITIAALPGCTSKGELTKYWPDQDRDGYGVESRHVDAKTYPKVACAPGEFAAVNSSDLASTELVCATQEELKQKIYLKTMSPQDGDCDDNKASTNPGAPEIFDGNDNNCDQLVDVTPAPEGLDLPFEKISINGKPMFASEATPWEKVVKDFGQNATGWSDSMLKTDAAYGFKTESSFPKDPSQQEALYNWALPYMNYKIGKASPETRAALEEELSAARSYAATLDVSKETEYLHTLQATDCTDIYRNSAYVDLGENERANCQQFFVYYAPDAPWREAIAQARARGKTGEYEYEPFIFIDKPAATPHRDLQARLYRRIANGDLTKEALQGWISRAEKDLAPALGAVEE